MLVMQLQVECHLHISISHMLLVDAQCQKSDGIRMYGEAPTKQEATSGVSKEMMESTRPETKCRPQNLL